MTILVSLLLANPPPPLFLKWGVLTQGQVSGFESETCLAITNENAYRELWNALAGPILVMPPEVNFDSCFVLGIFLGKRPTTGYGIETKNISIWSESLAGLTSGIVITVYANERCPDDSAANATAKVIACPWVFLMVERTPLYPFDRGGQAPKVNLGLERYYKI